MAAQAGRRDRGRAAAEHARAASLWGRVLTVGAAASMLSFGGVALGASSPVAASAASPASTTTSTTTTSTTTTDSWPTSLHDVQRTAASSDTTLSPTNAPTLTRLWSFQTGGPVATSPSVVGGIAYFGSWDGYEYAVNATTGALVWKTYLGQTDVPQPCYPAGEMGVSSPATVLNGVVYVGGGDGYFYALSASTGAVEWRVWVNGTDTPGVYDGHYNWAGPLVVNGYAYVGVASLGDCPLVQGALLQVSLTSHTIVNTLNTVPNGQVGGSIWTSPAYDPSTNTIYTATGNQNATDQPYAQAVLAINASTLEVTSSWKLPPSQAVADSDFGTSTTLFTDANGDPLVAVTNKDGVTYAFNRTNLAAGPVWERRISIGGDCPTCGDGSVSSGAFGGGDLYVGGGNGVINGTGAAGTVRAIDPTTGAFVWQHAAPGLVLGALAYDNGLVLDGGGSTLEVLSATTGQRLYSYDTGSQIYAGPSTAGGVIFVGNTAGQVQAFGLPSSAPPAPPADANCPAGFTCQDIAATPAGSEQVSGGSWSVSAGGSGVGGTSDSFRLLSEPTAGDAQVAAEVTAVPAGTGGEAGVMVRQSSDPGSPYYAVLAQSGGHLVVQYRQAFGGPTTVLSTTAVALPEYLMIQRRGDSFYAATSANGTSFTLVPGTDASLPLPYASLGGVAVASGTDGTLGTATLAMVTVGAPAVTIAPQPSASPCPSPWSCQDVGNPALVGDQSLSGGAWTVTGAGTGVAGASDQFHYVWQPLAADGTIGGEVTAQTATSSAAQAGFMLRSGPQRDAAFYGAWLTPGSDLVVSYRTTTGLMSGEIASVPATLPAWIEVARSGSTFTTYTSSDGSTWTPLIGSTVALPSLAGTIDAGMAVSSDVTGTAGSAAFTAVTVSSTAPAPPDLCPSGWSCVDVGYAHPTGDQYYQTGTWTVEGGGSDITGTSDYFRFVSQPQESDGTVSAQVVSQTDTNAWAKSGVMVRVSSSSASPYYGVFLTPGNGVAVQYRSVQGGGTTQVVTPGTAPDYLQISRSGDTYTGYTSSNGTTWTAIPNSTVSIAALTGTLQAGLAVSSHDSLQLATTVFSSVSITGTGAPGALPGLWSDGDVGGATPSGSATYANQTFTVQGGGSDIWGTADQFNYVSQALTGDVSIVARVTSQTDTSPYAKAGIIIKQSTTAGSAYALLAVTPGNGVVFQYGFDTSVGGGSYTLPNAWLRLDRTGPLITAYTSPDGFNWVEVGYVDLPLTSPATVGLAVCSHNVSALSTATFDNVTVTPQGGGPLPSPWSSTDVGSPTLAGSATYANGVFSVSGSGSDIWGTADQFQYVDQPLSGDATITAEVTSQTQTDPWAKAGVMVKQSTTAGSPYALLAVTPGNGMTFESNFTTASPAGLYTFPNAWLRLSRMGSTITAYTSSDGSTWTEVGTATVSLTDPVTVGLFVCSHNGAALSTATFANVSVTSLSPPPAPWTSTDVGSPALPGSSSYAGGVFTVNGAGTDIWGTADQFQYVDQPLSGDATITAQVTSQTNTNAWAKAGVMIKQSTTAGSPYALLAVTPGNGTVLQSNFDSSTAAGSYTFPNAWLRLSRVGSTITAYTSSNGSTWTEVGTATVSLTDPITVGLFVCSHSWDALSTATFANVSVTSP